LSFNLIYIEVEAKLNIVIVWSLAKTYPSNLIVISLLLENTRIRHPITDINMSIPSQERSGNTTGIVNKLFTKQQI
jgi:hypothetical protein